MTAIRVLLRTNPLGPGELRFYEYLDVGIGCVGGLAVEPPTRDFFPIVSRQRSRRRDLECLTSVRPARRLRLGGHDRNRWRVVDARHRSRFGPLPETPGNPL